MEQSPNRNRAKRLLLHYLTLAGQGTNFEAGDNYTRSDYRAEIAEIIDATIDAVKDELRIELSELIQRNTYGGLKV